jgi:hypothetical protein
MITAMQNLILPTFHEKYSSVPSWFAVNMFEHFNAEP